jgi:hypothetical protein
MAQLIGTPFVRAAGFAGLFVIIVTAVITTVMPARTVEAAAPATSPASAHANSLTTAARPGPARLGDLESHVAKLHADCVKQAAPPQCTVARWWEVTAWLYENKELANPDLVHVRELYLAVSRAWRGHLEGGVASRFNRELAIRLMDRSRTWKR